MKLAIRAYAADGKLSEHEAQQLLTTLCTTCGFCLPPLARAPSTSSWTLFFVLKGLIPLLQTAACQCVKKSAWPLSAGS